MGGINQIARDKGYDIHMKHVFALIPLIILGLLAGQPDVHADNRSRLLEEIVYRVQIGKIEDIKLLLERFGTPNATDKQGWPLLSIAAARTDEVALPLVKMLVEMGADVNYHGGRMHYPLKTAVQSGNADIVEYLLNKGANYRVTDSMGIRVIDFARQSGDTKIIRLIERAIDGDMVNLARMRSQNYLDEATYDVAYHSCATQYFSFYYQSGQDPTPQAEQDNVLGTHKKKVGTAMSHLATFFRIPRDEILKVFNATRNAIFQELENLVSNRWRRQKGVGQPGDMEKRCKAISEPYKEGIFDKEELEKRYN